MLHRYLVIALVAGLSVTVVSDAYAAGQFRERIKERMAERRQAQQGGTEGGVGAADGASSDDLFDSGNSRSSGRDPMTCEQLSHVADKMIQRGGSRAFGPTPDYKDVAYGSGLSQRLDVFAGKVGDTPGSRRPSPVIVMVHGGAWCIGDKAMSSVTTNKVARWTAKGFTFVSVNYPMILDGEMALQQADDVAKAVAYVQGHAREWGGDPDRVILMGHSAGAHLVSLVNASGQIRGAHGVKPVLGTVSLDSGATHVPNQMKVGPGFLKKVYEEAFGETEQSWVAASPYHQLDRTAGPWLGVCSTQRKDDPCGQAQAYADKSKGLGVRATVLPQDKKHGAINKELGEPSAYTTAVERFMASLDPVVAALLR